MTLEIGQPAPDFSIQIDDHKKVSLTDYRGKKLILYFYPKDDTPGCTLESCGFRDAYPQIQKLGGDILGVSRDGVISHKKFQKKYALPFDLGADEDEVLCKLYDVLKEKNMYGRMSRGIERSTFLIDTEGKLAYLWRQVNVAGHLEEVLKQLSKV